MLLISCDQCGKKLHPSEDHHYVVNMEAFAARDPLGRGQLEKLDFSDN